MLLVRRPDDDDSLPGSGAAGRIAARGRVGARRAAARRRAKLGVEVEPLEPVGSERAERPDHIIEMRDFRARISRGEPSVPQDAEGTQYVEWRWGEPGELAPAARAGSACARVLLRSLGSGW